MTEFQPKYCPECGSITYGNIVCTLCGFKLDDLFVVSDEDGVCLVIIIGAPIIILSVILFLFNVCLVCKFSELIQYYLIAKLF